MRKRLYFLLPDASTVKQLTDDLLLARIEERHLHFLAKEGVLPPEAHEASLLQKSDIVHGAEMGLMIGGLTGIAAGLLAAFNPPSGLAPQWGLLLVIALLGAVFGAWVASMVGSSLPNSRLARFATALAAGQVLLMVDVQRWRVDEITAVVAKLHPEARSEGIEPTIPAFP